MAVARTTVFVTYSHRDREWLDRLDVHLHPLQLGTALECWDDHRIAPGAAGRAELQAALARARVSLLLLSADYLASDFITRVELPALLQGAAGEGLVVLPLVVGRLRLGATPDLGPLKALNDPERPLVALGRAEQERLLLGVADAVQCALALADAPLAPAPAEAAAQPHAAVRLPLAECLLRLGCPAPQLPAAQAWVTDWLVGRAAGWRPGSELPEPWPRLAALGLASEAAGDVEALCEQALSWCAPRQLRCAGLYLSVKKVGAAWRQWSGAATALPTAVQDKLATLHAALLRQGRLGFLPARLLLGQDLPASDDEVLYFSGSFRLELSRAEAGRVPGALELLAHAPARELHAVVSALFQNPDPFVYPTLSWAGQVGGRPARLLMSRSFLRVGSATAPLLADALHGQPVALQGLGTLASNADEAVLQPWCCGPLR